MPSAMFSPAHPVQTARLLCLMHVWRNVTQSAECHGLVLPNHGVEQWQIAVAGYPCWGMGEFQIRVWAGEALCGILSVHISPKLSALCTQHEMLAIQSKRLSLIFVTQEPFHHLNVCRQKQSSIGSQYTYSPPNASQTWHEYAQAQQNGDESVA